MRFRAALVLITLAGYALRTHGLHHQSFWLDEVDAIAMAGQPVAAQLRKLTSVGENGPLYFVLFKGWLALAGTSEFGVRYLSAATSTLTVPLFAALAHRLFRHRPTVLFAAALAAASPYYVWYAQDAKMYPLYAFLSLAAQYCFWRGWAETEGQGSGVRSRGSSDEGQGGSGGREGGLSGGRAGAQLGASRYWVWWGGYVLSASLGLYVHLFAALQIAANTVAGGWLWRGRRAGRRGFAVASVLLMGPYVPLAAWQAPVLLRGADVGYQPAGLQTIVVALLEQLTWHLNPPPDRRWLVALAAIGLWGLWRRGPRSVTGAQPARHAEAVGVIAIWLAVPVGLTLLLQGSVPVFRDRYLMPLLVPLLLTFARAVAPPWRAAGIPCALFLVAGFGYGLLYRPPNPGFRAAAQLVRDTAAPGEPVGFLAEYAERPFAFYFRRGGGTYQKTVLPYTNYPGMSERDGLLAVARSLRGGRYLWVVRFEDWLWDSRDLTGQYLAARGARIALRRDFSGVSVTRYELPE